MEESRGSGSGWFVRGGDAGAGGAVAGAVARCANDPLWSDLVRVFNHDIRPLYEFCLEVRRAALRFARDTFRTDRFALLFLERRVFFERTIYNMSHKKTSQHFPPQKEMRDGWFFVGNETFRKAQAPIVWSLDYDNCADALRAWNLPKLTPGIGWPYVRDMNTLKRRIPNQTRVAEFWNTIEDVSKHSIPSLVMSGSARIVYQSPGMYEQDGISHVCVLNDGLETRGYNVRVDREALKLDYEAINTKGFNEHARFKMDIVLRQIRYAQAKLNTATIRFVFIDDLYAPILSNMFVKYPALCPKNVTLHLVHYVSSRPRNVCLQSVHVIPGVIFWPY